MVDKEISNGQTYRIPPVESTISATHSWHLWVVGRKGAISIGMLKVVTLATTLKILQPRLQESEKKKSNVYKKPSRML